MKSNAGKTHYKSRRLHLYLYFGCRSVPGSLPFSSPAVCTRPRAHTLTRSRSQPSCSPEQPAAGCGGWGGVERKKVF